MTSQQLKSADRSVAPRGAEFSDLSCLTAQLHALPEEEIIECGEFASWSPADDATLRLEIFQFLRNLEAQRPVLRAFH
jgi:hypothetical protein